LHVLAAIDRDIGAGHERRSVRAQVDDKICNFFGLAEASERDLRQDLSWDSPDDSRTGVNIIAFPSSLEDRRSEIAAFVRSPCRYCPFLSPEGRRYRLRRRVIDVQPSQSQIKTV
jgi:hypothetical protein